MAVHICNNKEKNSTEATSCLMPNHLCQRILQLTINIYILGVCFNHRLKSDAHLREIAKRDSNRVALLRRIKYLDDCVLRELHNAHVRPFLEYASLSRMPASRYTRICFYNVQRQVYHRLVSVRQDT